MMPLEVAWRLMFRVNNRVAADRCLARVLSTLCAEVIDAPKPYWKIPELWEVSLRSEFGSPPAEGITALLQAANSIASGWWVTGPTLNDGELLEFGGVFNNKHGGSHVPGLEWGSFSVGEFPQSPAE